MGDQPSKKNPPSSAPQELSEDSTLGPQVLSEKQIKAYNIPKNVLWFVSTKSGPMGPFHQDDLRTFLELNPHFPRDSKVANLSDQRWLPLFKAPQFQRRKASTIKRNDQWGNDEFFILVNGLKVGPLGAQILLQKLQKREILYNQLISLDKGETWIKIYEHPQFERRHFTQSQKNELNENELESQLESHNGEDDSSNGTPSNPAPPPPPQFDLMKAQLLKKNRKKDDEESDEDENGGDGDDDEDEIDEEGDERVHEDHLRKLRQNDDGLFSLAYLGKLKTKSPYPWGNSSVDISANIDKISMSKMSYHQTKGKLISHSPHLKVDPTNPPNFNPAGLFAGSLSQWSKQMAKSRVLWGLMLITILGIIGRKVFWDQTNIAPWDQQKSRNIATEGEVKK
jgi:hypothetical protein